MGEVGDGEVWRTRVDEKSRRSVRDGDSYERNDIERKTRGEQRSTRAQSVFSTAHHLPGAEVRRAEISLALC